MYPTDSHPEKGSSVEGLSLLRSVKEVHLSLSRNADVVGVGGINADDGTIGGVVDAGGGGDASSANPIWLRELDGGRK